jgi:hypothetical protein
MCNYIHIVDNRGICIYRKGLKISAYVILKEKYEKGERKKKKMQKKKEERQTI